MGHDGEWAEEVSSGHTIYNNRSPLPLVRGKSVPDEIYIPVPSAVHRGIVYPKTSLIDCIPPLQQHLIQASFLESNIYLTYYTIAPHQS